MRQKITLRNGDGVIVDCVVDAGKNLQDEMEKVFSIEKGYGLKAEIWKDRVDIVNYFRADTMASFVLLAIEETQEPLRYQLKEQTKQGG